MLIKKCLKQLPVLEAVIRTLDRQDVMPFLETGEYSRAEAVFELRFSDVGCHNHPLSGVQPLVDQLEEHVDDEVTLEFCSQIVVYQDLGLFHGLEVTPYLLKTPVFTGAGEEDAH